MVSLLPHDDVIEDEVLSKWRELVSSRPLSDIQLVNMCSVVSRDSTLDVVARYALFSFFFSSSFSSLFLLPLPLPPRLSPRQGEKHYILLNHFNIICRAVEFIKREVDESVQGEAQAEVNVCFFSSLFSM